MNESQFRTHSILICASPKDSIFARKVLERLIKSFPQIKFTFSLDIKLERASHLEPKDFGILLVVFSGDYWTDWLRRRYVMNGLEALKSKETDVIFVSLDKHPLPEGHFQNIKKTQGFAAVSTAISESLRRVTTWNASKTSESTVELKKLPDHSIARAKRFTLDPSKRNQLDKVGGQIVITHQPPAGGRRWREEVLKGVSQGRYAILPSWLHYCSYEGTNGWIERCQSSDYPFYSKSVRELKNRIGRVLDIAIKESKDPELDFISVGCGDGIKDAIILSNMVRRLAPTMEDSFIYYYPLDISIQMLYAATENIGNLEWMRKAAQKVRIMPLMGEIAGLAAFSRVYEEYKGNNLFSVLGNTIGNESEQDVLFALQAASVKGDFALIEYNSNTRDGDALNSFGSQENLDRHWHTVVSLDNGAVKECLSSREVDPEEITRSKIARRSFISFAKNVRFSRYSSRTLPELGLAVLHCYDKDDIGKEFERLGFKILYNSVKTGVGLLLAVKL